MKCGIILEYKFGKYGTAITALKQKLTKNSSLKSEVQLYLRIHLALDLETKIALFLEKDRQVLLSGVLW